MILTCHRCASQQRLDALEEGMRPGKSYERWCKPCGATTLQFSGIDATEQMKRNREAVPKAFKTGRR